MAAGPSVKTLTKVLGRLLMAIMEVKEETAMFKQSLESLHTTLLSLSPTMKDMEQLNHELGRPKDELELLIVKMQQGIDLVDRCSEVNWLNCLWLWCSYKGKLKALEDFFLKQFQTIMLAQMVRDQKESLKHQLLSQLKLPEPGKSTQAYAFMLPARDLYIAWSDDPRHWIWRPASSDRHLEAAELVEVYWLEISGWVTTGKLPPRANYEAYLVFTMTERAFGFKNRAVEVFLEFLKGPKRESRMVCLEGEMPPELRVPLLQPEYLKTRNDGWMEVRLGKFYVHEQENKELQMGVYENKDRHPKGGIVVRGIEIRVSEK